jgi:hypothetical protein
MRRAGRIEAKTVAAIPTAKLARTIDGTSNT